MFFPFPHANITGAVGGQGGGTSFLFAAPTIIWDAEGTDATPDFEIDFALGVAVSDVVRVQRDTSNTFPSPTAATATLDATAVSNLLLNFAGGNVLNGTYYYRARVERSAVAITDWSNIATVVLVEAPINTVAPVVTGTATVGQTLSTTNGTWSNTPTGYTYQWQRSGVDIGSATSNTYVLVSGDLGTNVTCNVTASNAVGGTTQASNAITLAGWTPASVSADIWLDVADLATMKQEITGASATTAAAVGSPVGSWLNKGTQGGWATCNTTGQRPALRQNGSIYYLELDGFDDAFGGSGGGSTVPFTLAHTNFTAAMAVRIISKATAYEGGLSFSGIALLTRVNSGAWGTYNAGDLPANTTLSAGTDYVLSMDRGASGNGNYRINSASDGTFSDTTAQANTNIGGDNSQEVNAYLYGIVGAASQLGSGDIASMHTYLGAKAGLTI